MAPPWLRSSQPRSFSKPKRWVLSTHVAVLKPRNSKSGCVLQKGFLVKVGCISHSILQIQMLSEGYPGYSNYSYIPSCIEHSMLNLARCTRVRFTGRVAEGKHSAYSCGRSTCRQLSLIKCLADHRQSYNPRHRWKRLFEALRGNMVWPFSRFPNMVLRVLQSFKAFFWGCWL